MLVCRRAACNERRGGRDGAPGGLVVSGSLEYLRWVSELELDSEDMLFREEEREAEAQRLR